MPSEDIEEISHVQVPRFCSPTSNVPGGAHGVSPDFRMNPPRLATSPLPLLAALLFSVGLHGLLFFPFVSGTSERPPPRPSLAATLRPPALPVSAPVPEETDPLPQLALEETKAPPAERDPAPEETPRMERRRERTHEPPRKSPEAPDSFAETLGTLPPKAARSARQQLEELARRGDFYPLEAIENRWQGEVSVRIFLDAQGQVIAARVEAGSGYPILDEAALRAVRALTSLPADGLEEAIFPVRFHLH
jgi:protein TonB